MDATLSLEWSYTPADFFEEPVDYSEPDYTVHIDGGQVVATFTADQPDGVFAAVQKEVEAWFLGAQVVRNRPFQLSAYTSRRTRPDGSAVVGLMAHIKVGASLTCDAVLVDAAGKIKADTRAERI